MKKLATLLLLAVIPLCWHAVGAAQNCNIRRISHQRQLYYYQHGQYHNYHSGNYGQLYYHNNGYYYPHYQETIVLVPKAIQVEVYRDHYYSIDGAAQQSLLADAIVGRLLRLQSEGKLSPSATGAARLPTGPVTKSSPTGKGGGSDTQELRAGEYQNEALLKVVNDSCVKCHGPKSRYTKLTTEDGKLNDLPAGKVWECFGLVNSSEMPKGGKALEDNSVKLFYEWAKNARR